MMIYVFLLLSVIFGFSTAYYVYEIIKTKGKNKWDLIFLSLSSFLTIFTLYCYYLVKNSGIEIPLTIFLYIITAAFVLIIVRRSYILVESLRKEKEEYKDMVIKLEYEAKEKNIELNSKVKALEDSRSAMINILEDISEQKDRLEINEKEMMELNKTLADANRDLKKLDEKKNQFTSIASHELKTPLASIHGFVQLLQKKEIFENPEKREQYLSIVVSDTNRLTKLVSDILDVSRIDLGTLRITLEEVSLKEIINEAENEILGLAKTKNLTVVTNIEQGCPEKLTTDKGRIIQVLLNLLSNAVHYTESGGSIKLNVSFDGKMLNFYVKDTGIGIQKEEQPKIFERFYQVDNWMTRKIGGSGLGLAICKGILENLGGKIWVESEFGNGTTFYFTLPPVPPVKEEVKEGSMMSIQKKIESTTTSQP